MYCETLCKSNKIDGKIKIRIAQNEMVPYSTLERFIDLVFLFFYQKKCPACNKEVETSKVGICKEQKKTLPRM